MIRRICPAAALLALAACTANPAAPTTRVSRDANPGASFDSAPMIGTGAAIGDPPGDAGPGIGAGVGIAAPADAATGQLGSGNEDPVSTNP